MGTRGLRTKNLGIQLNSLQGLKGEFQEYLIKLAYCMTVTSNQMSFLDEVTSYLGYPKITLNDSNCLGLITVYSEIKNTGNTKIFSFLRFLQHFTLPVEVHQSKLRLLQSTLYMKTVWLFYSGLISFQPEMEQLKEMFLEII